MDGPDAIDYIIKNNIPGVLVECGVDKGAQPFSWIETLLKHQCTDRHIYLYDTFTGMTEPTKDDYSVKETQMYHCTPQQVYNEWKNQQKPTHNEWCYGSLEEVQNKLFQTSYPKDKLHFIKGDVLETLNQSNLLPNEIALLRMDTDWYESSKIEMEQLYPRVVHEGLVIMDDYFHWNGQRKATDEYLMNHQLNYKIERVNAKVGAFIKILPEPRQNLYIL
jgi:O-methyltransferase